MISRIVVVLGVILLGVVAWRSMGDKGDLGAEYRYAIKDIDAITSIHLMDRDGNVSLLQRKHDYWTFNGNHRAREDAMENILDAIKRVDLQYIPQPQALPNIVQGLSSHGIKVTIYGKADRLLKSYYIGGATPDERGTYIIMADSDHPAVVGMPNFEGSLRPRFTIPALEWRDRIIFRESPDDIQELLVDYPGQPEHSFIIRRDGDDFQVLPFHDDISMAGKTLKKGAVEAYLQSYKSVGVEAILMDPERRDSLVTQVPFVHINLLAKDDESIDLALYPIAIDPVGSVRDKLERYHAIDANGDLYLVQHLVFEKLFWGLDFFFDQPEG